jgi:hypothetical protein
MTQNDAGPGDWSDREWESPEKKPKPQAKRRLVLPTWALVAALVALVIILCVGLILIVRAIRGGGGTQDVPTALPADVTAGVEPSATFPLVGAPTAVLTPTATAELPGAATEAPAAQPTGIVIGSKVVVQGTRIGLNVRAEPSTGAKRVGGAKDGDVLVVIDGPQQAGGLTWWKVRTLDGKEGWAAGQYLVIQPNP